MFNQVPHQVDIARLVIGSKVRTVRAWTSILDPARPTEGSCTALLEFENGAAASLVYSGYDRFDSDELHDWVDSTGRKKEPSYGKARVALSALKDAEEELRLRTERYGYGSGFRSGPALYQPHFGLVIASYERGDLRVSTTGLTEYSGQVPRQIDLASGAAGRVNVLDELCDSVLDNRPVIHDGQFAKDTLGVCLGILQSARERREISLLHI